MAGLFGLGATTPDTPNYAAAANQTAIGNRANQNNPYGNLTWKQDANGQWTQDINLAPEQQGLLNQQINTQQGIGTQANQFSQQMGANLAKPLPSANDQAFKDAQSSVMGSYQPYLDTQEAALRTQLANQGINYGSEAYNNAFMPFNQQKNQLYNQAYTTGMGAQQQEYNQAVGGRASDLATQQGLMGLAAPTNPTFPTYMPGGDFTGAMKDTYGADLNASNAANANKANEMAGIFGIGSALLGGGGSGGSTGGQLLGALGTGTKALFGGQAAAPVSTAAVSPVGASAGVGGGAGAGGGAGGLGAAAGGLEAGGTALGTGAGGGVGTATSGYMSGNAAYGLGAGQVAAPAATGGAGGATTGTLAGGLGAAAPALGGLAVLAGFNIAQKAQQAKMIAGGANTESELRQAGVTAQDLQSAIKVIPGQMQSVPNPNYQPYNGSQAYIMQMGPSTVTYDRAKVAALQQKYPALAAHSLDDLMHDLNGNFMLHSGSYAPQMTSGGTFGAYDPNNPAYRT